MSVAKYNAWFRHVCENQREVMHSHSNHLENIPDFGLFILYIRYIRYILYINEGSFDAAQCQAMVQVFTTNKIITIT